jgi:hypothetical protein
MRAQRASLVAALAAVGDSAAVRAKKKKKKKTAAAEDEGAAAAAAVAAAALPRLAQLRDAQLLSAGAPTPRAGTPEILEMEEGAPRSTSPRDLRGYTAKKAPLAPTAARERSLSFDGGLGGSIAGMSALEAKRERARLYEQRGRAISPRDRSNSGSRRGSVDNSINSLDDADESFTIEILPENPRDSGATVLDIGSATIGFAGVARQGGAGAAAIVGEDAALAEMAALATTPVEDYVDDDDVLGDAA